MQSKAEHNSYSTFRHLGTENSNFLKIPLNKQDFITLESASDSFANFSQIENPFTYKATPRSTL